MQQRLFLQLHSPNHHLQQVNLQQNKSDLMHEKSEKFI